MLHCLWDTLSGPSLADDQFPQANTKGCTMEACAFRDAKKENVTFRRHPELEVVGVSADDTAKQASFADQFNLLNPMRVG